MDEPTASLDFGNQQKLLRIIKELSKKGKTILFTTHNPNHLVNLDCDIYVVKDGKVSKIDVLTPEILRDIYGEDFEWRNGVVVFN
jgi:iron complex transport system ATP-binding protein